MLRVQGWTPDPDEPSVHTADILELEYGGDIYLTAYEDEAEGGKVNFSYSYGPIDLNPEERRALIELLTTAESFLSSATKSQGKEGE